MSGHEETSRFGSLTGLSEQRLPLLDGGSAAPVEERRRSNTGPRLSWASQSPFVRRSDDGGPRQHRRRWVPAYRRAVLSADVLAAAGVLAVTFATLPWSGARAAVAAAVGCVLWVAVLALLRGYDRRHLGAGPQEFQSLLRGGLTVGVVVAIASYATQTELPRRIVVVALPVLVLVTALLRYALRRRLHAVRARGRARLRTLLVGDSRSALGVQTVLARSRHEGHDVVGVCGPSRRCAAADGRSIDVVGAVADIPQVVHDHDIDVVIVAGGHLSGAGLRRLSWALEHTGAELVVSPGLVEVMGPRLTLRPTAGLSLLHVEPAASRRGQAVGKRTLDIALGGALFVASLPVLALAALAVRLTSRGPAFFSQVRVGQDGQRFRMHKLRTMVVDAEERRAELAHLSDRDGLMFKMRRDPRVTPVGAILRRFSLDELPQFFNVVRGEMSLVGPRPPLVEEHDRYHDEVYRRLRVRPGLTGLWQVSGRADLSWDEAIRLDLRYVDNWSVTMDLFIIWKTLRSVVKGSGAY